MIIIETRQHNGVATFWMALLLVGIVFAGTGSAAEKGMQIWVDPITGQRHITENNKNVLAYNYHSLQPPKGLIDSLHPNNVKYARARSNYIHPLYGPDGEELTYDWSKDHPHHRGIYWAWPEVDWQGKRGDSHALQHVFVRPTREIKLKNTKAFAEIKAENVWLWEDYKTPIARETVIIKAHRLTDSGRHIDLTFRIEALEDDVAIARRGTKHYGGLNIRLSPIKDLKLIHHADPAGAKPRMAWSDSFGIRKGGTKPVGFAVFEKHANPDYPGDYIEYPVLPWFQPTFPAAGTRYVLKKGNPLVLQYRLWIRPAGETSEAEYRKQWKAYNADPAGTTTVKLAKPLPKQIRFADWEVGAFFHYNLNPFTGQEHGDGQEPPSKFNPTELDVNQWMRTAKSMGARYAVLTARHEGGFCLWPSKTTDYTIAQSPYKAGKGDLVREFVDACRKHGLKVGLYHTADFDANQALRNYKDPIKSPLKWGSTWGSTVSAAFKADPTLRERFKKVQIAQMRELMTRYGPIDFMWSDHWNAKDPDGVWRAITDLVAELQPNMVFMGPETWVPGNETGHVVYPLWNAVHTIDGTQYSRPEATLGDTESRNTYGLLETAVRRGHPLGKFWRVRECTTHSAFHYGGWFWHPDHIKKTYPRKLWEHLDLYYRTVGLGANTIINLPPDTRGLIPDDIAQAAKAFGDEIRRRFSNPIAELDKVTAGDIVELGWDKPRKIDTVVTMENIANGQKVAKYTLEAYVNGKWQRLEPRNRLIAIRPYNSNPGYETIGHKKIDRIRPVTTNRIRFRCLEAVAKPAEIRRLSVFKCNPIVRTYKSSYPYLSGIDTLHDAAHGGMKRDLDYRGGKLEVNGRIFEKGLLLCPENFTKTGIAEFDLEPHPEATGMKAFVGIEDMVGKQGSCQFIVEGWIKGQWKELYKSPRIRGGQKGIAINVKFPEGMEKLRLKSTDARDGIHCDHAAWADARLTIDKTPLPERGAASHAPAKRWEEAFVTGNGRMGAMLFGRPEHDILVANHCRLFLPLGSREIVPDLASCLPELRAIIRKEGYRKAMDFILKKAKDQGYPGIVFTDPLHPGFFIHIKHNPQGEIKDYVRTQDFRTGEVAVRWADDRGKFARRVFVSRTDNLIVFSLTGPGKGGLDCELAFPQPRPPQRKIKDPGWRPDVKDNMIVCKQEVAANSVTYHNTYAMGKGGYDAAVRIKTNGGRAQADGDKVKITGADEVVLLMRIVPWKTPMPKERSEAWAYAPAHPDFSERLGKFVAVPPLADSSVVPFLKDADADALMPQLAKSMATVYASYDALFAPHARSHAALFERVSLDLKSGKDRKRTSADLLAETRKSGRLSAALMEKMYDAGRYMFICCAGELPPNLQGIWTGSWKPAWSGDFTLDTNLQLAMKHAFSGNLAGLMEGYFRMIEGFIPEWQINAKRTYGCDGVMTNARASNTALLIHWGTWPGNFWTAGCGWLSHFFFDQWQFTGDEKFLRERAVPFLKEVVAFYEDYAVLNKETGLYEFIPSYSPETGTGITSTMDVMVLKDALKSLITAYRVLDIETARIPKLEAMLARLPDYRINKDGAIAEWVPEGGPERYKHRHLSHLHSCYEALDDLNRDADPKLWKAAQEAVLRRIHSGGEVSSHGRVHMGLAAAFLEMAEEAYGRLEVMASGASMYDSLMCSHEPKQAIFNVDANGAIPEIVNRMLVRSYPGRLDLLPALPKAWPQGEIRGMRARQQITIDRLAWDADAKKLTLALTSERDQTVKITMPGAGKRKVQELQLKAGTQVQFDVNW